MRIVWILVVYALHFVENEPIFKVQNGYVHIYILGKQLIIYDEFYEKCKCV